MTAKEELTDLVGHLSESDARSVLEPLRWEQTHGNVSLTLDDVAAIKRGLADAEAGRITPHAAVKARFSQSE